MVQLGGGVPATLINLSRLGVPVSLCTFFGEDIFSKFTENELKTYGIPYRNLYQGKGIPITITSAMITKNDRTFISYTDAAEVTAEMEEEMYQCLQGAAFVEMSIGYINVYRRLKEKGSILILDTGWDEELSVEKYKEYLELADYYIPNQIEAMKITNTNTPEEAAVILEQYFDKVVIKLGENGCLIKDNGVISIIPCMEDIKMVDATGAGDAFMSGFIYGLFHNYEFVDCIIFGNITGGTCVSGIGCLQCFLNETELHEEAKKMKMLI
jgi:sugar/nucleoside kinase (ribokinase family)